MSTPVVTAPSAEIESRASVAPSVRQVTSVLSRPAVRASLWIAAGYAGSQVLRLAGNIVLSRLLFPEAFGAMALIMVLLQGLMMFSDIGIGPSIIQHQRGDEPSFLNTAWTMQVGRGLALWIASWLIAWPAAEFYHQPEFLWYVPAAGLLSVITGLNSTTLFTVKRHLQMQQLTVLDLVTQAVAIVVNCVWAYFSPTVWALIGGTLLSLALKAAASHLWLPGVRNRLYWDRSSAGALMHFGKWIFVNTTIGFFAMQVDRMVLGRLVSISMLGVYSVAFAIAILPNSLLASLAASVMYPLMAKHCRNSPREMADRLHAVRAGLLVVGLVLVLGVFVEAEWFFRLLYDSRYREAGPIAQMLCAWIWLQVLGTTVDPVLFALGDARSTSIAYMVKFVATTAGSIGGFYLWGLPGFAAGLFAGVLCGHVVLLLCLRTHDICVAKQDLQFSGCLTGLALLARFGGSYLPYGDVWFPQLVLAGGIAWSIAALLRLAKLRQTAPDDPSDLAESDSTNLTM